MTSDTEESSATGQVVRQKQCSKCHRPCKGHSGPYGKDCQMPPFDSSTEPDSIQDQIHDQPVSTGLLAQLITQMTDMNVNIQAMVRGQQDITAVLTGHAAIGSARQPSETTAATTPNFNLPPPASERPVTARSTETLSRLATPTLQQGADPNPPGVHRIGGEQENESSILPNGNRVFNKAIQCAKKGEFVNIAEFLSISDHHQNSELEPSIDKSGNIVFKQKKLVRIIDSFNKWLMAWNNYEYLLVNQNPGCYKELSMYRNFIQSCDQKFIWSAVYSYDSRFRAKLSQIPGCSYSNVDSDIYTSVFDVTAVRRDGKRCFRCKAPDHVVQECPFPATDTPVQGQKNDKSCAASKIPLW